MVFLALAFFVIAVLRWAVLGIVLVGMGYAAPWKKQAAGCAIILAAEWLFSKVAK